MTQQSANNAAAPVGRGIIVIETGGQEHEWGAGEPYSAREAVRSSLGLASDDGTLDDRIMLSAPWSEGKLLSAWFTDDSYTMDDWLSERGLNDDEREYWSAALNDEDDDEG